MPVGDSFKHVVIGGGAIGLSTAYHLARMGCDEVLLLEQNELASGTSWHAAGIVGPLRATMNLTAIAKYALTLIPELETETGQSTGYTRTGGFWLAEDRQRLLELQRVKAIGDMNELHARFVEPEEIAARLPVLNVSDLLGALWVEEDGQVNPYDLCMVYARAARARGVTIREHARVRDFVVENGAVSGVVLEDKTLIRCERVINCAGLWARELGRRAGASVPVQAVEHMYVVTEPIAELPKPCPFARDMRGALYIKEDAGRLVIGTFEPNARLWDWKSVSPDQSFLQLAENWDHLEPMLQAAQHRVPCLENTGLQHFMNGPESFTPDTKQVMGESPEVRNFYVAAGMNSLGIMSSPGVGKAMAEWVVGEGQPMDLWEVDVARFDPGYSDPVFLRQRTQEAVANQMDMHWPFKQFRSGRNFRQSSLYPQLAAQGAVFGSAAGWERPLWFAGNASESELVYSYDEQNWWPYAAREAIHTMKQVSSFELSPFSKILIEGKGAAGYLQRMCTANVDVSPGQVVYTLMLNARAGVEAEVTVTRLSERQYVVVGGAATRFRDLAWLRRHVRADEPVTVTDQTERQAVIGIMGPGSRALLQDLLQSAMSKESFPFATSQEINLGKHSIRAARVSFVGELGWEIYANSGAAVEFYDRLTEAGQSHNLRPAGLFCMESCRLEKGYHHWGHDIGPEDTPLHVGLSFAVDLEKPATFIGKDELLRQKEAGMARRLVLFQLESRRPLLLHDEPIFRDGEWVGRTTSGGLGFRTDTALCFGMISKPPTWSVLDLQAGSYEVELAGERWPMTILDKPPYDPKGERLRG